LFDAIDKMDLPPLPAVATPFPCTVSQAFLPSQLSVATCLSPDGSGSEGGGEDNLSAVVVTWAVELRWIGGGAVSGLVVDWWWIGSGKVEGVGGRVAVVWWLNGGRTSGGGSRVAVASRAVARAI
jgi:hypothetical protein